MASWDRSKHALYRKTVHLYPILPGETVAYIAMY